ncbi:DUF1616 domain-containing protein [Halosegnis longus]|uniref:DUF1616 domain-containing protein n=1 Tax=Halosegnis longus TaxID=2216012 RepID=UPI00096AB0AE|nr:DUF1616 domain-containing protein [Salella cibi]
MASRWRLLLPAWLRGVPADLAAVILFVVLTLGAVFIPGLRETPLRVLVGLPFVLFIPGYAFVAALFPEAGNESLDSETDGDTTPNDTGIDGIERVALAFGVSIAIVPLIGLVLNFTPWGIRLVPIMIAVSGFTLGATAVATTRRRRLPVEEQFSVPYQEWVRSARTELFEPASRADAALNVLLVVSLLLAAGSVGFAVAVPNQGERFTELSLLTENEDGELVADNYPQEFTAGEPQSLYVGVGNQERQPVNYTVIVAVQNVTFVDNETQVREQQRLRTFRPQVAHNETWRQQHTVAPTLTGERLRLTYFLYKDQPPATPTTENAYREVHLWVNVTARQ